MRKFVEWGVKRPALANCLMLFLVVMGGYYALHTRREVMPEFNLDMIMVSVVYKGASAEEIEESICIKIEEKVAGIEGVKKITSEAREGIGRVTVELHSHADARKALDDIKNEVDQIDTFPKDSETPIVVEMKRNLSVINLCVYGDATEKALRAIAERARDDLLLRPGISQVELFGDRDHEILIEVNEHTLRKHGLTIGKISETIRNNVLDLPGGTLEGDAGQIMVRTKGQLYKAEQFKDLPILTSSTGTIVRLNELARITETFEDVDVKARMAGKPAIVVNVKKTSEEDALKIASEVKAYVKKQNESLPHDVRMAVWADSSIVIKSRLELLTTNGIQGFILVFIVLSLFIRLRLAFWVALGIPISILGSFAFLGMTDFTLNMLTMFSFIVVLGVVVDDAIVIGENVHTKSQEGLPQVRAAIEGTAELAYPVMNSVATTIVAFAPMLFVAGTMGKLMRIFPVAIIAVLLVSLFEAFLILPSHLAHMKATENTRRWWSVFVIVEKIRSRFDQWLQRFIEGPFTRISQLAIRNRYIFCALILSVFIMSLGLVASARVGFVLFPKMDSDTLSAKLVFPAGTNFDNTLKAVEMLEQSARTLDNEFPRKDGKSIIKYMFSLAGQELTGNATGSHVADLVVQLIPSEERGIASFELMSAWRAKVGTVPGALAVTFSTELPGVPKPGGTPIEIRLLGRQLRRPETCLIRPETPPDHHRRGLGYSGLSPTLQERVQAFPQGRRSKARHHTCQSGNPGQGQSVGRRSHEGPTGAR